MGQEVTLIFPSHAQLVQDLKFLRRRGLLALRSITLPALREAAVSCGFCADPDEVPKGVEDMLKEAVRRLGENDALSQAAAHSFGLVPGSRSAPAQDRRKAAAQCCGVAAETFRKEREHQAVNQLAEAVLALCREHRRRGESLGEPGTLRGAVGPGRRSGLVPPPEERVQRPGALPHPQRDDRAAPFEIETTIVGVPVPFVVHVCPADLLRDIDILVSPENVYLEMSKTFSDTFSGALRRACAVWNADGELVEDVLADELHTWLRRNARPGLPVKAGTVAPTSPGAMTDRGIRRIYHAAVAVPLPNQGSYEVSHGDIARAVRRCFALARAERNHFAPPLSSICFPLMGAGHGGLAPEVSAAWTAWAVREELDRDRDWTVHLVIRNRTIAEAIANLGDSAHGS
ncbi:macro domain-containing protein [Streptomyces sp. URMC 129]|uniref:macro domain-containing protein n=1 Tax=Streptomyces sp. URMC 129 TaxID=3423407 RepID=UPI003F1D5C83